MKSEDLQKMAYLYFCGEKDRELLWGKREMKYYDFRRLLFLINHIKFWDYGASFWNRFSGKFLKNIKALEAVYDEESENGVFTRISSLAFWKRTTGSRILSGMPRRMSGNGSKCM